MVLVRRMVVMGIAALVFGMIVNQIHPRGIRIHQLLLLFPCAYATDTETVAADSALILMFEETAVFLDIRPSDAFAVDHIPGAVSLPFVSAHAFDPPHLDRDKPWVVYDFQPKTKAARYVCKQLKKSGSLKVRLLEGGYAEWLNQRYPIEPGEASRAPSAN